MHRYVSDPLCGERACAGRGQPARTGRKSRTVACMSFAAAGCAAPSAHALPLAPSEALPKRSFLNISFYRGEIIFFIDTVRADEAAKATERKPEPSRAKRTSIPAGWHAALRRTVGRSVGQSACNNWTRVWYTRTVRDSDEQA
jgi:hypothetical protein